MIGRELICPRCGNRDSDDGGALPVCSAECHPEQKMVEYQPIAVGEVSATRVTRMAELLVRSLRLYRDWINGETRTVDWFESLCTDIEVELGFETVADLLEKLSGQQAQRTGIEAATAQPAQQCPRMLRQWGDRDGLG